MDIIYILVFFISVFLGFNLNNASSESAVLTQEETDFMKEIGLLIDVHKAGFGEVCVLIEKHKIDPKNSNILWRYKTKQSIDWSSKYDEYKRLGPNTKNFLREFVELSLERKGKLTYLEVAHIMLGNNVSPQGCEELYELGFITQEIYEETKKYASYLSSRSTDT